MWTALAATSINSSLFLTALAPNLLALEMIRTTTGLEITWTQWFLAAARLASPVYLGSGYIASADYRWLGAMFGVIFLIALLVLRRPFLLCCRAI